MPPSIYEYELPARVKAFRVEEKFARREKKNQTWSVFNRWAETGIMRPHNSDYVSHISVSEFLL
jgi:hypothetical protein